MTRIFYDWEFYADEKRILPISVGMVAEGGRELYLVNEAVGERTKLWEEIRASEWLMHNVVPHLPLKPEGDEKPWSWSENRAKYGGAAGSFRLDMDSNVVAPMRMIRNAVRDFILETPDPELWAWYGAYDYVALVQMFGRMVDLPQGIPMWTNDIRTLAMLAGDRVYVPGTKGDDETPKHQGREHHALDDAKHDRVLFEFYAPLVQVARLTDELDVWVS